MHTKSYLSPHCGDLDGNLQSLQGGGAGCGGSEDPDLRSKAHVSLKMNDLHRSFPKKLSDRCWWLWCWTSGGQRNLRRTREAMPLSRKRNGVQPDSSACCGCRAAVLAVVLDAAVAEDPEVHSKAVRLLANRLFPQPKLTAQVRDKTHVQLM